MLASNRSDTVRQQRFALACLAAAVMTMAGCRKVAPPKPAEIGPVPANSFARAWMAPLDLRNDDLEQLHVRDHGIFAYTEGHASYTLSRQGGALTAASQVTSPATRLGPPVVLGDKIVYPTNTTLEIYDLVGKKIRTIELDFAMRSPAVGKGNTIYVGADFPGGARFIAIDIDKSYRRSPRWAFVTGGGVSASPAMFNEQLFVGSENNRVYAVTLDRKPIWPLEGFSFRTDGRILADLRADDFGVYIASTDTKLYCLDRDTGKIKWEYYSQHPLTDAPVVTSTTVYQAVPNLGLAAIDKLRGKYNREPLWISTAVTQVLSEDAIHVYGRLANNSIVAIDKRTGEQKFKSKRRDFAIFATNSKDATIFATTKNGHVYAITPVLKGGITGEVVLIERDVTPQMGG
jgi:outer membrane protein assembly factor BamB